MQKSDPKKGRGQKETQKQLSVQVEALKRGVHRLRENDGKPIALHVIGVGKAGANFIAEMLRHGVDDLLTDDSARFTALAVDIGDQELAAVREAADKHPECAAPMQVRTFGLKVPARDALFSSLRRHREFLKLEYPRYYWNPNYEPWVLSDTEVPEEGEHFPRSVAKALYSNAFYDGERPLEKELRRFADSVDASQCESIVCVVFGLGGGTGSGMVVDLARHVSSLLLGRRVPVLGVAFAPCEGDTEDHKGSELFPVLNELDCMLDKEKNEGVIAVWGDLYRNPFTAGFLLVPQQMAWEAKGDLASTHARVDADLASFFTRNKGVDLRETVNLINWNAPSQLLSSSASGHFGPNWINVLVSLDGKKGEVFAVDQLATQLGLREGFTADFIELRTPRLDGGKNVAITAIARGVGQAFSTGEDPHFVEGDDTAGPVQFVVPGAHKIDLDIFFTARDSYDEKTWEERLLYHSWLMDLGVMLSEPAIRFDGMAGECLWGCACWVVVPYEQIRGEKRS